jgi:hypothetical protein
MVAERTATEVVVVMVKVGDSRMRIPASILLTTAVDAAP